MNLIEQNEALQNKVKALQSLVIHQGNEIEDALFAEKQLISIINVLVNVFELGARQGALFSKEESAEIAMLIKSALQKTR